MKRLLPNWLFGALAGFAVAVLAWTGLSVFGIHSTGPGSVAFDALGAAFGAYAGSRGGPMSRWCGGMATAVGAVGFTLGFVGPLLLRPDSPQGPLLGFFVTDPCGIILGAFLGLLIGGGRRGRRSSAIILSSA
jgi:hypothetical protein